MIKGVFWSAVGKYSSVVVQLVITMVLARLLSPKEFGVVAIATVLITFLNIFSDMGLGAAIIQRQDLMKKDLNQIFTFSLFLAILLGLLLFVGAYPISSFYQDEQLVYICQLLSISLFFHTLNVVPNALISKDKRFKFIAKRQLFFHFTGGVVSIIGALLGLGCYALVVNPIYSSIGVFITNYKQNPLYFQRHLDLNPIKKIYSYSGFLFAFNLFNYFTRNLDKLIIGKYFSLSDLGYYEKSYRLMMLPLQQITHVVTPVMHPVLASLQNNYIKLARDYTMILRLLTNIGFPIAVFLYFAAENLIFVVFGDKWLPSVPVFEILVWSVPVQILMSTTGGVFQASGRTDWPFYAGAFHTIITVLGFIIAAVMYRTMEAMAWAFVITFNTQFFVAFFVIYQLILGQSITPVFKQVIIPLLNATVLAIVLFALKGVFSNHIVELTCQVCISAILSILLIHITKQYDVRKAIASISKKIRKR